MDFSDEPLFKSGENWHALKTRDILNRLHRSNESDSSLPHSVKAPVRSVKDPVHTIVRRPSLTLSFCEYRWSRLDGDEFLGFCITYIFSTLILVPLAPWPPFSASSLVFLILAFIVLVILKLVAIFSFKHRFISGYVRHVVHCFNDDFLPFFVVSADLIKPDFRRFALSTYRDILLSGAVETLFFTRGINWPLDKILHVADISLHAIKQCNVHFLVDGSTIHDRISGFLSTVIPSGISPDDYERLSTDLYQLTLRILHRDSDNDL